ncbi:MAG: hypothetical protein K0S32_2283 [Bacteroidetes bacterium]|jgi:hypothetical protein|nr:hypothetical protein [Bacteroidota bacterium]
MVRAVIYFKIIAGTSVLKRALSETAGRLGETDEWLGYAFKYGAFRARKQILTF